MPISLPSVISPLTSTRTLGGVKVLVARVVGSQDTPDEVGSGDAISLAFDKLNEVNWEYLTMQGSDISVVAGTSTYELPALYKHHYSLRLLGQPRTLQFIRQQDYDYMIWNQAAGGTPTHYTMFNEAQTGKVKLLPTPTAPDTLEYRYYRQALAPTQDDELFDVMPWMLRFVIAYAQHQVAVWRGAESKVIESMAFAAEDAWRGALAADRNPATEDAAFKSQMQMGNSYSLDHAQYWINEGWD